MPEGISHGISDGATLSVFGDSFRRFLRRVLGQKIGVPALEAGSGVPEFRTSSGLREFWKGMQTRSGLQILDLGSASQANVTFITGLGHKLYTEDLLRAVWTPSSPPDGGAETQSGDEEFFRENLIHADGQFDGILCWDLFDFLADPLVKPLLVRLHRYLKPGGTVLCFFHTGRAGEEVPLYQYRIRTDASLQLTRQGTKKLHRHFNNRSIETLFKNFASLKFYLARDNLREVISVR